jgi:hypothetical protein
MECITILCDHRAGALHLFISVNFFPFVSKESHCILNISVFKNLQSLEVCGGLITDAGVKNIKDLKALTLLNLSQNGNLTDKTLELISGTISLFSPCAFIRTTVLVSIVASVDRPDHAGVVECVQLPGVQLGPPPPETAAEPALPIPRVLQGDGKRDR